MVTTNTQQTISGPKTFSGSLSATNSAYFSGGTLKTSDTTDLEVEKTLVHAGWPIQDGSSSDYKATYFSNGVYIEDIEEEDEDAPYYIAFPKRDGVLATTNQIPTATSQLTNDSGFITSSSIPTNYVTTDTQQNINASKTIYGDLRVTDDDDRTIDLIANQTGGLRIEIDDDHETSILGAGELTLKNSNSYGPTIDVAAGQQADTTLTLPSITGTLALTSDIPTNYVTTDTAQTISGSKTFTNDTLISLQSDPASGGETETFIVRDAGDNTDLIKAETLDEDGENSVVISADYFK